MALSLTEANFSVHEVIAPTSMCLNLTSYKREKQLVNLGSNYKKSTEKYLINSLRAGLK